ncbi:hypothetical protein [Bradyrhizobium sp. SZCCHNS3002]|uniref:hypothetical protein n=1 Tax=Bradyrhizobium sp. SZCCHNS3002 TaxID=3057310 RepID=UPI0028EA147A|nr:hypothetical protein [Bradyrhizobium sp. SZCCHNS3002]
MKPPGKSTLARMQQTAFNEAERIEISQDARVLAGLLKAPMPDQVALRDDFAAIVRLIDAIESDATLKEQLQRRIDGMNQMRLLAVAHAEAIAAAAAAREIEPEEMDAE